MIRKYKFYFKSGKIGNLRTDVNWNKKTVKDYNKMVGKYGGLKKVVLVPKSKRKYPYGMFDFKTRKLKYTHRIKRR